MKKILSPICAALCLGVIIIWQIFSQNVSYYLVSVLILIISMIPFFSSFENGRQSSGEIALTASLIAIAVVSRAVFYLVPQVKPIAAVVIVSGACLGARNGYLIGAFSAFVSNFIFGQGIWTPFQMVALGIVGFAAGIIFSKLKAKPITLVLSGFLLVFIFYGIISDACSVIVMNTQYTLASVAAVYIAGIPFNLVFAVTTSVFLGAFGRPFIKKVNRICVKYGIRSNEVKL